MGSQQVVLLVIFALISRSAPSVATDIDPVQSCIPGTFSTIKANMVRMMILCYVYDCPEGLTDTMGKQFNIFHHFDLHPEMLNPSNCSAGTSSNDTAPAETAAEEDPVVPVHVLNKLAKLTSALEKDRNTALKECTDWQSMLNKLLIDIMQANQKCFLEPSDRYPAELPDDGEEIDCDEMTVYMRQLQKHFGGQCDSQGKNCPDKLKTAVKWFGKAYKQLGRSCYYDAYDYLDNK